MNQAVVNGAHEALLLVFRERYGALNKNTEVANAGRLLQFVRSYRNFHAALCKIAGLQVLHGVKGRAGA
jgi:hypothetical protein